jgi:hypothetical protein
MSGLTLFEGRAKAVYRNLLFFLALCSTSTLMLEWQMHVEFVITALPHKVYSHGKYLYCIASRFICSCIVSESLTSSS